ncbi:c6 transcription [Neofusicoccum parvum]|nr:c6 transcription [Neofusicoccum parvum]
MPPQQISEAGTTVSERAWPVPSSRPALPDISSHCPPKRVVDDLIVQYDERCNYQPLPLFNSDFTRTYELRDEELVNAVLAIALRLSPEKANQPDQESSSTYAARVNEIVAKKLSNGGIGLATIQALCLLSFWEFTGGQKEHSWLHLDVALWLAKESRLTEEPEWDIDPKLIIANNIRLYDIWGKVQHFATQSNVEAGKSLWTGDSEYGSIISALMEYESQFPDEHRFSEQTSGAFKDNKAYWAPWFSIQFMYHAILCVLNHPFLLSMRLDPIRESSPRTFRQTTADLAKLHSYWAFRFIGVAKEWDYEVTDPLIAYAVTIAATIFDHYRLSDETQAKRDARDKFTKCVAFVREAAKIWPIAANMFEQSLQNTLLDDVLGASFEWWDQGNL